MIGSVVIGLILLVFVNRKPHTNPYIVVVQCDGQQSEQNAMQLLRAATERCVVKSKTVQKGRIEMNMEVRLKSDDTAFINDLDGLEGVESAVLVSYNGEYMG